MLDDVCQGNGDMRGVANVSLYEQSSCHIAVCRPEKSQSSSRISASRPGRGKVVNRIVKAATDGRKAPAAQGQSASGGVTEVTEGNTAGNSNTTRLESTRPEASAVNKPPLDASHAPGWEGIAQLPRV